MNVQIPENFKWSFSKLSAFETCPYSFYLQYLHDPPLEQQQNAWAEYGILCHSLLEEYANGKLEARELTAEYKRRYPDVVVHNFPPYPKNYAEKTFQQGIAYFDSFTGFGDGYDVVSAEEYFKINIGNYDFVGISDLVLRDKRTSDLIVIDHKTKSESSMKNELELYKKQLYIYAEHVKNKYGKFPKLLQFNMIKSRVPILEEFTPENRAETLKWVEDSIDLIFFEDQWEAKANQYYCRYICPVFQHCEDGMCACKIRKKNRS